MSKKLKYTILEDLVPIFENYYHLKDLDYPLREGDRIRIGSKLLMVDYCDKLITMEGYGVKAFEVHYGTGTLK